MDVGLVCKWAPHYVTFDTLYIHTYPLNRGYQKTTSKLCIKNIYFWYSFNYTCLTEKKPFISGLFVTRRRYIWWIRLLFEVRSLSFHRSIFLVFSTVGLFLSICVGWSSERRGVLLIIVLCGLTTIIQYQLGLGYEWLALSVC